MAVSTSASHTSRKPVARTASGPGMVRAALVGLILLAGASPVSTSDPVPDRRYVPGQAYAVELTGEQANIDLPGSSRVEPQSYILIVSSLGDAASSYRIQLAAPTLTAPRSKLSSGPDPSASLAAVSTTIQAPPVHPATGSATGNVSRENVPPGYSCQPPGDPVPVSDSGPPRNIKARPTREGFRREIGATQKNWSPPRIGRIGATQSFGQSNQSQVPPGRIGVETDVQRPSTFFIHTGTGPLHRHDSYSVVSALPIGLGQRVEVLLDQRLTPESLAPGLADSIIHELESALIPQMEHTLGMCRDVDGTGRFTVLLTPLLDQLQGGQTSLKGFVRSSDFESHVPSPFSNQRDMLYLNSNLKPGNELRALLAHEFTHAICFSERTMTGPHGDRILDEDDWLNEAIAHIAENLHASNWQNIDHRIDAYLTDPGRYPLVVPDYYRAGLWRNHGCRGATYLFLRLCVDQFGPELLKKLIKSRLRGTHNLSAQTGLQFDEAFRLWTIALAAEISSDSPNHAMALSETADGASTTDAAFASSEPLRPPSRTDSPQPSSESGRLHSTRPIGDGGQLRQVAPATVRKGSWVTPDDRERGPFQTVAGTGPQGIDGWYLSIPYLSTPLTAEIRSEASVADVGSGEQRGQSNAGGTQVGYRSIRLNGRIGRYELRGPRVENWLDLSQPMTLTVRGTAARFARIELRNNARIRISADPGTRLQVTVIPVNPGAQQ